MEKTTILCHYVKALMASLERNGHDPIPLLHYAGIPLEVAEDANARIPYRNFIKLIRKSVVTMQDEYMGLVDPAVPLGSFFYAGHLFIGAPNLKRALELGIGYYQHISDAYELNMIEEGDIVRLEVKIAKPEFDPDHLFAEFVLCAWHRTACWLISKNIILKEVNFDFSAPDHESEYRYLFPCPRNYNQSCLSLSFSTDYMFMPITQNSVTVMDYIRKSPENVLLNPVEDDSYSTKIRLEIEACENNSFPTFELIAEKFFMTPKTLRKKLKSEGVTYQKIKDIIRRDIAIYHLTQHKWSISEIAIKIGFSEPGAFIRAFKGWTGVTPRAYRETDSES
ncbi:AraC family transcriptional regulator [Thalassotalea psychrophila]|uniref:AraC family transcriptional regulator n=1 Tax=Thalassotalea psychrophila TaxID=3065647 RepID=A0ABY9TZ86_9GAMM|nr:AraC family transcriptional regulator [Colwelliaceae bacterium SQ149]